MTAVRLAEEGFTPSAHMAALSQRFVPALRRDPLGRTWVPEGADGIRAGATLRAAGDIFAGVDVTKAKAFADSDKSLVPVAAAQKGAEKYGVVSTPSFLIGETGKPLTKFDVNLDDAEAFKAAFDELLKP